MTPQEFEKKALQWIALVAVVVFLFGAMIYDITH